MVGYDYLAEEVKEELILIDLVSKGIFTFKQLEEEVSLDDVYKVLALESFKKLNEGS